MFPILLLWQILERLAVDHQSAFPFVDKIDVILLFVLFLYQVSLCINDLHKEDFELLNNFATHSSQPRDIAD